MLQVKAKLDESLADIALKKLTYERVVQEKQVLEQQLVQSRNEANLFKSKIEEQLSIHNQIVGRLEKAQSKSNLQSEKIKELEEELKSLDLGSFRKQITSLQSKLAASVADFKDLALEKKALESHQDSMRETMKQAIQKHSVLEQEVVQYREMSEKVCFFRNERQLCLPNPEKPHRQKQIRSKNF